MFSVGKNRSDERILHFLSILDHFQNLKSGFEPLSSKGGGTLTTGSTTKKNAFLCFSSLTCFGLILKFFCLVIKDFH